MHVIAIGSDRAVFNPQSENSKRQIAYGTTLGKLDIIVFSLAKEKRAPIMLTPDVHAYPTSSANRLMYFFDALRIAWRIGKANVVTTQDPFEAGLTGYCAAFITGAKLHVQIHTDFLSPEFAKFSFMNRVRVHVAKYVLPRADRIRVVSERIRRSLSSINHQLSTSASVLPIFVDIEKIKNARARELAGRFSTFDKKLLVVSRLEPEKNIELALTSFATAAPPNACLIIVGEGRELTKLKNKAQELHIADRVFFEGRQDPAPYYALVDLVLFPSKYDGYGLVIVEALAAGKPVLSTDVGVAHDAGAIISDQSNFSDALRAWFEGGPREGALRDYPYGSFDDYVTAYCEDLQASL